MAVWICVIALLLVLIYFLTQRRSTDDAWQRYRRRKIERRRPSPDQPIDERFNFDQTPTNSKEANPDVPS